MAASHFQQYQGKKSLHGPQISEALCSFLRGKDCVVEVLRLCPYIYAEKEEPLPTLLQIWHLFAALQLNQSLRVLDLSSLLDADITREAHQRNYILNALAQLLTVNFHITTVFLDANPIPSEGVLALIKALKKRPLEQLSLPFCQFEKMEDAVKLMETLAQNDKLGLIRFDHSFPIHKVDESFSAVKKLQEKLQKKLWLDDGLKQFFSKEEKAFMKLEQEKKRPVSFFVPLVPQDKLRKLKQKMREKKTIYASQQTKFPAVPDSKKMQQVSVNGLRAGKK
jgi:hypothetical protein